MILTAIVILLAGVCVWGVFGHLDTNLPAVAIAENGETTVFIKEADIASVKVGMPVTIGSEACTVTAISAEPITVDETFGEYALHVSGLQTGEWVFAVRIDGVFADGVHSAEISIESVFPMSFVLN